MNTQITDKNTTRFFSMAAAVGVLLFMSITPTFGQKEDLEAKRATSRDGLMANAYLTRPDISDDLDGTSGEEYFYKFQAGPGKLTVILEVTAGETNAGATLDLFGPNSRAILSNMLVQATDRGTEQGTETVNISKAQEIVIRIKGMRYGSSKSYPGVYKIRLEGPAAVFGTPAPGAANNAAVPVTAEKGQTTIPAAPTSVSADLAPPATANTVPTADATQGSVTAAAAAPSVPPAEAADAAQKPPVAQPAKTDKDKKAGAVDRVIDKTQKKSTKLLEILEKAKTIKP